MLWEVTTKHMCANFILYFFFVTCAFVHCLQVLCQRENSWELHVPSEKEVLGFWHQGAPQRVPAKLQRPVAGYCWQMLFFFFVFIFMWTQFLVGICATFQNNARNWVQEWFFWVGELSLFAGKVCLLFWVLQGSNELMHPRRACKNSSSYSAARCPRY